MSTFDEYSDYDGLGIAELIRKGQVSNLEVMEAAIARAEAVEPHLNCFAHPDFAAARAAADAADTSDADVTDFATTFGGVPFAVKDLDLDWAGAPRSGGSRYVDGYHCERDAPLAAAMRNAGLISLGKTTAPEFGITGTTEPGLTGPTRNPWDPSRIAGGSSGGSAAAVAAGVVPIAHGSDGAGSIRIPAACCGLVGLKTSRGRTLRANDALDVPHSFVSNFVLTRSVRDTAAMLDAVALRSPYSPALPDVSYAVGSQREPGTLIIAASTETPSSKPVDPQIQSAFEETCALLERLGHRVELRAPQFDWRDFYRAFGAVGASQLAADVRALEQILGREPEPEQFEPLTWRNVEAGRARSGMGVIASLRVIQAMTRSLERFFDGIDVYLSPVLGTPLPEIGYLDPTALDPREQDKRSGRTFPFTPPFNASGQPAISLPLAQDAAGLPVGMQFAASYGDDLTLLQLAGQLESATGWLQRRPSLSFLGG